MKRMNFKRIVSLLLCLALTMCFFTSCSHSLGEPLMTLEGHEISVNMYRLWLSRIKGNYGGSDDTVWDQVTEDGKAYNELFTDYVKQNAMRLLCAIYEFDRLGLKLPESEIAAIDETMLAMLAERGNGNRSTLNSELSQYGVNDDILREIYIIEAKLNYLSEHLYGEDGIKPISDTVRDEYYKSNYVRIKQIFFYTANKPITDESGNYVYDQNNQVQTKELTEEDIAAQKEKAEQVMISLNSNQDFDLLMVSQNEDIASEKYPNGYYFTKTDEYVDGIIEAAFELDENEFTMIESDYGIHIIKRLPLEEKGYSAEDNADFFTNFDSTLKTEVFIAYLSQYEDKIKIDEELLAEYDVKNSIANTVY